MRLTKLKLAGFKTFVDPTTVLMPGQLVGVVGPNGCGKSNIIDAVRWVLGESKAAALRGESMQDVIFNGSTTRKPVGRASVELVFDNSLGRAAGQWSQYAEIAVKRVLDRSGDSTYYLNNTVVRRKDVIDVFLGTGLGPRAYAIIEQGMISRIIEARPDDLRMFLEEAAGVTKYKERRKETEHRLQDARDNLARVDDIRMELGGQIERLEGQAEVARQYKAFAAELTDKQHVLWVHKRNEARDEAARLSRAISDSGNLLEAETARLRAVEADVETARADHYAASDAVHAAQTDMFAANAEVARLESELARQRDTRSRVEARLAQLGADEQSWIAQRETAVRDTVRWQDLLDNASLRVEAAQARHQEAAARLPAAEDALRAAEAAASAVRRDLNAAESQIRVEDTHRQNAMRALDASNQRRARLAADRGTLQAPDAAAIETMAMTAEAGQEEVARRQDGLGELQQRLPQAQAAHRAALEHERVAQKHLSEARARREALVQLQQKVQQTGQIGDWLRRHNLDAATPLWKVVKVEPGWEQAVEAVLRERVNALALDEVTRLDDLLADAPPGATTLALDGAVEPAALGVPGGAVALVEKMQCADARWRRVLLEWLHGIFAVEDLTAFVARRGELPVAGRFVNRAGHMVSPSAVVFHAPDARTHGLMERQREIDDLVGRIDTLEADLARVREQVEATDEEVSRLQETLNQQRRELQDAQQRLHSHQVELLKLNQARARFEERLAQIVRDESDVDIADRHERDRLQRAEQELARAREMMEAQRARLDSALEAQREGDNALREARALEQSTARDVQEAKFSERECVAKLDEISRIGDLAKTQLARIDTERAESLAQRDALDEARVEAELGTALDARGAREAQLTSRRDALEGAAARLRELDELRLRTEHVLHPLRDSINDLRLKEQAARLSEEQYQQRLTDAQADEAAVMARMPAEVKEGSLVRDINRLTREIAELGAVNLAALDELTSARERKGYLDAQSEDLTTAINTLEDAIRRIDRETREQLIQTFETVNGHFGQLFPQLFGGGQARLVMTGEEILDAGIQVIAQPPGKKNASIQLLSGGEKALTAIALVFSMFQLNPAPFCMLDEVDAPLDDSNTERFCDMVKRMSAQTQFIYISHNKITMEMANQLVGVTMQERGCSRVVEVDIEEALKLRDEVAA